MEEMSTVIDNVMTHWETYLGYALAVLAGFDKVALVFIKTLDNIRDAWVDAFGNKK